MTALDPITRARLAYDIENLAKESAARANSSVSGFGNSCVTSIPHSDSASITAGLT
jgi:hypothetical protein